MTVRASRLLGSAFVASCVAFAQSSGIVVTSASSFAPGLPPVGSIGTIFCAGLKITGTTAATGTPLPLTLAGVTVAFDGTAAPLLAVADLGGYQQINFQVPVPSASQVVVEQDGVKQSAPVAQNPDAPGDFFQFSGTNYGVFQHATDYSLVTSANPARPGETVIAYATGLSPVTPSVPLGQPAPASPLSHVTQVNYNGMDMTGISVDGSTPGSCGKTIFNCDLGFLLMDYVPPGTFGDTTGQLPIPFMGLAPGMVGVYQINFVLPQGLRSGEVPIRLVRQKCLGMPGQSCGAPANILYFTGQKALMPIQ